MKTARGTDEQRIFPRLTYAGAESVLAKNMDLFGILKTRHDKCPEMGFYVFDVPEKINRVLMGSNAIRPAERAARRKYCSRLKEGNCEMKRFVLGLAVSAAALAWSSSANAAPIIQYEIYQGATLIGTGTSATGNIVLTGTGSIFTVIGSAQSTPTLPSPNFSTNTTTISSTGAGTVTIKVSTTGLTSFSGGVMNTFNLNSLVGGGFTSATISNYFDSTGAAYGTGTLLGTKTWTGTGVFAGSNGFVSAALSSFSETTIYSLTYGTGSPGSVTASAQLTAVPEPATWGLMLLGFGAMGGMLRSRRRVATRIRFA